MLSEDGKIDFTPELTGLIEQFLAEYQARKSPLASDLERGLVITYALGVLCCNLESLWECLGDLPVFDSLQPRALFEACSAQDADTRRERLARVTDELSRRGWLGLREH